MIALLHDGWFWMQLLVGAISGAVIGQFIVLGMMKIQISLLEKQVASLEAQVELLRKGQTP